jgi:hypothetical protein
MPADAERSANERSAGVQGWPGGLPRSRSLCATRQKFDADYCDVRSRTSKGNRPRIEAIAKEIGWCLETNLYAVPSRKAMQLTKDDRRNPIICYLFRAIRPDLVFVHSNEPICFFEEKTGCSGFTSEAKRARWQGHDFWLFGLPARFTRYASQTPQVAGRSSPRIWADEDQHCTVAYIERSRWTGGYFRRQSDLST